MRILEIEIENFKGIKHLKFDTNADVIILSGVNGSGKTTILEAIYWCLLGSKFNSVYSNSFTAEQSSRVRLRVEKQGRYYTLEVKVEKEGDEICPKYFIEDFEGNNEYSFPVYNKYVKCCILNDFFYENNFIFSPYFRLAKIIKINPIIKNYKELNLFAKKIEFPINKYQLVFDESFSPQIYLDNHKLSGGYYSEGDNILRFIWSKIIFIKYVEQKTQSINPIFLDDTFSMISEEYKQKLYSGLTSLKNQLFITKSQEIFIEKTERQKVIEIDLNNM